uniref:CSON000795 protein n=1 Tax=Culicoides sonorensis TaxID=179676 RepID=A0A336MJ98_CULSO
MTENLKFIVQEVNSLLGTDFNLISFDSLSSEVLLQCLVDVFSHFDACEKFEIKDNDPEESNHKIMDALRKIQYRPENVDLLNFRTLLVHGDKKVVHPILGWIFQNKERVKKTTYLAKFLIPLNLPPEAIAIPEVSNLWNQYQTIMDEFKEAHKSYEQSKQEGAQTRELRSDIGAIEVEIENVKKRIERTQGRLDKVPQQELLLEASHNLRIERERQKELQSQIDEQKQGLQRSNVVHERFKKELNNARLAAQGASPQNLLESLIEEVQVLEFMVQQKLPQELTARQTEVQILEEVLKEPNLTRDYLFELQTRVEEVNTEVQRLVETKMNERGTQNDTLGPFRQQAAMVARKKEQAAEALDQASTELREIEAQLQEKQAKLQNTVGEVILRGEELKQFVNTLRAKSNVYKEQRAKLASMRAETADLTQTLNNLKAQDPSLNQSRDHDSIIDCTTCTMKRHDFTRKVSKKLKKMAKLNLMNIFNENISKPLGNFIKNEIVEIQRNKIKAEYHQSPGFIGTNKVSRTNGQINVRRIEFSSKEFSPNKPSLREQLKEFAQKHNPSTDMFEDMLQIMESNGVSVPKNLDVIFEPLNMFDEILMSFGHYLNFGIVKNLENIVKAFNSKKRLPNTLKIDLAIYMVKSKPDENNQKPPHHLIILGRLLEVDHVFVIGIYKGAFPSLLIGNQILKPLNDELATIEKNPIDIEKKKFKIEINAIICDPVANSIATCTALPDSISGCSRCDSSGTLQFVHGITSYPPTVGINRYDDDFNYCVLNGHHIGIPILNEREFGLKTHFVIDYKSLVCEGVMKRMMNLWTHGKLDYRLNNKALRKISAELLLISKNCPKEFRHKPKTMDEIDNWTNYDWRQFLLYYGPAVLKNRLSPKYYKHFLYLHLGIRISCSLTDYKECGAFIAGQLLNYFVNDFAKLYSPDLLDYNIHNLLHIENMVHFKGPLDNICGFNFDKQFDMIERLINEDYNICLQNLGKRIAENTKICIENQINEQNTEYPFLTSNGSLVTKYYTLTVTEPDNHVFLKNMSVVKIERICREVDGQIVIVGRAYDKSKAQYEAAIGSQKMLKVWDLSDVKTYKVTDILVKTFKIDTPEGILALPLLSF